MAVVLMRLVLRHQVPIARQILYSHVVVVEDLFDLIHVCLVHHFVEARRLWRLDSNEELIDKAKLPAEEIFFVVDEGSDTFHLVS